VVDEIKFVVGEINNNGFTVKSYFNQIQGLRHIIFQGK